MPYKGSSPIGFYFSLGISDVKTTADTVFQEVSGLSTEHEIETIGEGDQNLYNYTVPNVSKYNNLVLKRGLLTEGSALAAWVRNTIGSDLSQPIEPKQVYLNLLNEQGLPLSFWSFENTWPVKWSVSDFNAQNSTIVIETLELSYTWFRRQ